MEQQKHEEGHQLKNINNNIMKVTGWGTTKGLNQGKSNSLEDQKDQQLKNIDIQTMRGCVQE
jgi:hypothetical protein